MSLQAKPEVPKRARALLAWCTWSVMHAFLQLYILQFSLFSQAYARLLASLAKQREAQVFGDTRLSASETWLVSEMLCHEKACLA